jgi:hypothetical protein
MLTISFRKYPPSLWPNAFAHCIKESLSTSSRSLAAAPMAPSVPEL